VQRSSEILHISVKLPKVFSLAVAEVAALFQALQVVTEYLENFATSNGSERQWDAVDHIQNSNMFVGHAKESAEFVTKLRCQVAAGNEKAARKTVENHCTEEQFAKE
jgi:hypothetical protein